MAKNDFQYGGWNSYTLQCCMIMTLISSGDCTLQYGMWLWNRDSEFTNWQHPAVWYVALGRHAVEFAQWQHPGCDIALGSWHVIRRVAAPCNMAGSSGMTYHGIAQTSAIFEFYIWFRFWPYHHSRHVILHQLILMKILDCTGGAFMASEEREPITEVWGQSPWSGGQGPLKLTAFSVWTLEESGKFASLSVFCNVSTLHHGCLWCVCLNL